MARHERDRFETGRGAPRSTSTARCRPRGQLRALPPPRSRAHRPSPERSPTGACRVAGRAAHWSRNGIKAEVLQQLLGGRDAADLDDTARVFAADVLARHLRAEAVERAEWHRTQGHRLVIVSASLAVYLRPIAERLRFDAVLATELEVGDDGRLTGRHARRERARTGEGAATRRVARRRAPGRRPLRVGLRRQLRRQGAVAAPTAPCASVVMHTRAPAPESARPLSEAAPHAAPRFSRLRGSPTWAASSGVRSSMCARAQTVGTIGIADQRVRARAGSSIGWCTEATIARLDGSSLPPQLRGRRWCACNP